MIDVFARFLQLDRALSPGQFTAVQFSSTRLDFVAKTIDGAPIILLHDSSTPRFRPALQLKYLTAEFHATCLIHSGDQAIDGQFAIIQCDPDSPELYELFIRSVVAATANLPPSAGTDEIQIRFEKLANLFSRFLKPSGREVSGLWAELFVIAQSFDIPLAVACWRADAHNRFDFVWNKVNLEVKATTHTIRSHDFALEQLEKPSGGKGFVVSLLLQSLNGGVGVMHLATEIERALPMNSELRQKVWTNIAADLGSDFGSSLDKEFDRDYAQRHAVLFNMEDIPVPRFTPDPRITSVRFIANLAGVMPTATGIEMRNIFSI